MGIIIPLAYKQSFRINHSGYLTKSNIVRKISSLKACAASGTS
jgi:hypothetical protein